MNSVSLSTPLSVAASRWPVGATVSHLANEGSLESALIRRVLDGEVELFYELVRTCERSMFFAAQSLLRNEADSEEVVQEAALKAFKALARFRLEAKFSTWLIQITINEAKARLRKDRRNLYQSIDDEPSSNAPSCVPREIADSREIPSETLLRKELGELLRRALASLPTIYRVVLTLRYVNQLSIAETADALGITQVNLKTRLSRARFQMRSVLMPALLKRCSCPSGLKFVVVKTDEKDIEFRGLSNDPHKFPGVAALRVCTLELNRHSPQLQQRTII